MLLDDIGMTPPLNIKMRTMLYRGFVLWKIINSNDLKNCILEDFVWVNFNIVTDKHFDCYWMVLK